MKNINFNYSELRGKIKAKFSTQEKFGEAIGISKSTLSLKLSNKNEFSQYEINRTCEVLDIPKNQIAIYFFTENVKELEKIEKE